MNPSGKLPASFPRAVGQEPLYYAQLPTGRPAHGDPSHMPRNCRRRFMSRYMDEDNSALFPFGWGLSSTASGYSQPTASRAEVPLDEVLDSGQKPVVDGGGGNDKRRQLGRDRSGSALYSQYRGQRGTAGAGGGRLCPRYAGARRDKTRRVPAGLRRGPNFYNVQMQRQWYNQPPSESGLAAAPWPRRRPA